MKDKSYNRKIFDTVMTTKYVFLKFPLGGGVAAQQRGEGGCAPASISSSTMVYDTVSEDSFVPKFRIDEDRVTGLCRLIPWTQR